MFLAAAEGSNLALWVYDDLKAEKKRKDKVSVHNLKAPTSSFR